VFPQPLVLPVGKLRHHVHPAIGLGTSEIRRIDARGDILQQRDGQSCCSASTLVFEALHPREQKSDRNFGKLALSLQLQKSEIFKTNWPPYVILVSDW